MPQHQDHGFHPFEVSPVHVIYVALGLFICIFSYLSLFIKEKLYIGEAPIAAAFGIIVGPVALKLYNPSKWAGESGETPGGSITHEITLEVMRVTIALSVFAVGVELPKKYLLRHWRSMAILLGPVMAWGWLITALFIYALIPGLDFLNSLVIAACVSPTDPILAQAVVGGPWAEKHVPAHVRHMLMCESGCNDGAAFPFLYLAFYLSQNRNNVRFAIARWFYETWAYEIILGTLLGALIGYCARKFMRFSERRKLMDRESFVAQYVSLAIASMGVNVLLGSDDLLAAFACGTAFAWDGWFTKQTEDSNFSSIVDLLFNISTFIYIGANIPWHDFVNASLGLSVWRLIVLTILVFLLKRLPIMLLLWKWIPDIKTFREAIFSGHFGPMGVGAIFIATLGRTLMPEHIDQPPQTSNDVLALTIQPIVYFFVLCSIIVHGLTVPFFAFGKTARRRAHTLTRTWSMKTTDEPAWMSRVRRVRTGDEIVINVDDTSSDKLSDRQLSMIGRGAIGGSIAGDLEREISSSGSAAPTDVTRSDDPASAMPYMGLAHRQTEADLENAKETRAKLDPHPTLSEFEQDENPTKTHHLLDDIDDVEDSHYNSHDDPSCDYLGDDCIEIKRYREQLHHKRKQRQKETADRTKVDVRDDPIEEGADIGQIPMDREDLFSERDAADRYKETDRRRSRPTSVHNGSKQRDDEPKWPKVREWIEGNQLVIEYQPSFGEDPQVHTIALTDADQESIASSESLAHGWIQNHLEELGHLLGSDIHHSWNPSEAAHRLLEHGIPQFLKRKASQKRESSYVVAVTPAEETLEQRDARASMLFGAMTWARNNRDVDLSPPRTNIIRSPSRVDKSPPASLDRQRSLSQRSSSSRTAGPHFLATPSSQGSLGTLRKKSLRKKVLCGQIGLRGRKCRDAHSQDEGDDYEETDDATETDEVCSPISPEPILIHSTALPDAEPQQPSPTHSKQPSIILSTPKTSSPAPTLSSSPLLLPGSQTSTSTKERKPLPRLSQLFGSSDKHTNGKKEKYFPRSKSAGDGLTDSYRGSSLSFSSRISASELKTVLLGGTSSPSGSISSRGVGSSSILSNGGGGGGGREEPSKPSEQQQHHRSSSIQWLDIADPTISSHRGSRLYHHGEETIIENQVDSSVEQEEEEGSSPTTLGLREGMNKIAHLISAFTAPKGEGMGNPGPISHPHLFPDSHSPLKKKDDLKLHSDESFT